jgi:hypothetical protein
MPSKQSPSIFLVFQYFARIVMGHKLPDGIKRRNGGKWVIVAQRGSYTEKQA